MKLLKVRYFKSHQHTTIVIFACLFAIVGVILLKFSSASITTTVLTVHANDNVTSLAICLNDSLVDTTNTPATQLAACLQTNDPVNPTKVRFGYFNRTSLAFSPIAPNAGWLTGNIPSSSTIITVSNFSCATTGHSFTGIGPINGLYYGEEATGSNTHKFASYTSSSHSCTQYPGTYTFNSNAWATPTITCPNGSLMESDINQLQADLTARKSSVYCLASGKYTLTSPLYLNGVGVKLIGDPIRRPDIDASQVVTSDGQNTVGIYGGGAKDPTIANLIVHGAPTTGAANCLMCGNGIYTATGTKIYNVFAYGNQSKGISGNYASIENTELLFNGNVGDVGSPVGGVGGIKFGTAFSIKYSAVIANIGVGIWCDVGCDANPMFANTKVDHNYVASNYSGGIRQEISTEPMYVTNNVVVNNVTNPNLSTGGLSYHGGIEVISSQNMTATNNILSGNANAGLISKTDPTRTFITNANITFKNNSMNGQRVICSSGNAIVCTPNH